MSVLRTLNRRFSAQCGSYGARRVALSACSAVMAPERVSCAAAIAGIAQTMDASSSRRVANIRRHRARQGPPADASDGEGPALPCTAPSPYVVIALSMRRQTRARRWSRVDATAASFRTNAVSS